MLALLAVASFALLDSLPALGEPGGPSLAVYGGYSGWWDDVEVRAFELRVGSPGVPVGVPIPGSANPDGSVASGQIEVVARYTAVAQAFGLRPTVAVAYREIVGRGTEKSQVVISDDLAHPAEVERELLRSLGLEVGVEMEVNALLDGLRARAFVGPDFTQYRHLLRYPRTGFDPTPISSIDREWFPGVRSGFEIVAPVGLDLLDGVSIGLRTVYTRHLGGKNDIEAGFLLGTFPRARQRLSKAHPEHSLSVQVGVELELY